MTARTGIRVSPWWPHPPTPKQWVALAGYERVPEVLYGGGAGGGKSEYLLLWATLYADNPASHVMLFRRTFADLSLPGALLDRAKGYWLGKGVAYNSTQHRFTFPSGATVTFGYMQNADDRYRYQGTELTGVGFDEAGQLRPEDMSYMASRLRRIEGVDIPLTIRYASNPGGPSHDYLRERFVTGAEKGVAFVPALLHDNPYLDQAAYREMLARLDPIERRRLEEGDWDVMAAGGFFEVDKIGECGLGPPDVHRVRAWDLAATPAAPGTDPDWTAGVLMANVNGEFWIEDVQRFRAGPGEVERAIGRIAERDGHGVTVVVEREGGSAGEMVRRTLGLGVLRGYNFRSERQTGSKYDRAKPLASAVANGFVRWHNPTREALAELRAFTDDPKQYAHDDVVDALSMAYAELIRARPKVTVVGMA